MFAPDKLGGLGIIYWEERGSFKAGTCSVFVVTLLVHRSEPQRVALSEAKYMSSKVHRPCKAQWRSHPAPSLAEQSMPLITANTPETIVVESSDETPRQGAGLGTSPMTLRLVASLDKAADDLQPLGQHGRDGSLWSCVVATSTCCGSTSSRSDSKALLSLSSRPRPRISGNLPVLRLP